jgi:hypothetical protein
METEKSSTAGQGMPLLEHVTGHVTDHVTYRGSMRETVGPQHQVPHLHTPSHRRVSSHLVAIYRLPSS